MCVCVCVCVFVFVCVCVFVCECVDVVEHGPLDDKCMVRCLPLAMLFEPAPTIHGST